MAASQQTQGDEPAIGIDLGTTNSCVAVWQRRRDRVEIICNEQGDCLRPSCVAFTDTERLVGMAAIHQVSSNPANSIYGENYDSKAQVSSLARIYLSVYLPSYSEDYNPTDSRMAARVVQALVEGEPGVGQWRSPSR
ncbi:hypothetical protein PR202_ga26196 [Eleusine coracana subsp. coracana]|uniref:Uncharacterized protein n=1 Tax=Eleusine coracana subsp. coracana TaxID=191504 RepID=A0AAV5DE94_ELECO|nr:hypothetical protein PR202_ga26196 [Eleusine coracana subsp. coracana]